VGATQGAQDAEGYRVVTAVGQKRVGRVVGVQGDYYVVRRSLGRGTYPLPQRNADIDREKRLILMRLPRRDLFAAPKVRRGGALDPATDGHYSG
jgi:hypothetical protein